MVECNSIEHSPVEISNIYSGLNEISFSDQQNFRINKINEIKDYFVAEIKERELMSKRLSEYIAYKSLIVLSATSGSISIASFAKVIGAPVASASLSLTF